MARGRLSDRDRACDEANRHLVRSSPYLAALLAIACAADGVDAATPATPDVAVDAALDALHVTNDAGQDAPSSDSAPDSAPDAVPSSGGSGGAASTGGASGAPGAGGAVLPPEPTIIMCQQFGASFDLCACVAARESCFMSDGSLRSRVRARRDGQVQYWFCGIDCAEAEAAHEAWCCQ
jgi:hypothetical protein